MQLGTIEAGLVLLVLAMALLGLTFDLVGGGIVGVPRASTAAISL